MLEVGGGETPVSLDVTFAEAIGEIARAVGRAIRYVPVSVDEYASMLAAQEVPAELVSLIVAHQLANA